jgi:nucleoside diphosphate kinase
MEFMLSGLTVAMVWQGDNIIQLSRRIIGATNSKDAAPGTIRNFRFGGWIPTMLRGCCPHDS